jgi:tRNA pseudouridine38-40 synthase
VSGGSLSVRNIRLKIEYDGTDFCGWQKQPKVRTVEGELVRVLTGLIGCEPEIVAAARTDSGVHALGQVVNFSCALQMDGAELAGALNSLLPPDIRVIDAREAPLAFNARFDASKRVYRYELSTRPTSVWRKHRWYVKWELSPADMQEAAHSLVGDHDFSAFTCKEEKRNPWISVDEIEVGQIDHEGLAITFSANRFLRKMVRNITGTLVEVGRGKIKPEDAYSILSSKDRAGAGPCAPPHGLYLAGVEY